MLELTYIGVGDNHEPLYIHEASGTRFTKVDGLMYGRSIYDEPTFPLKHEYIIHGEPVELGIDPEALTSEECDRIVAMCSAAIKIACEKHMKDGTFYKDGVRLGQRLFAELQNHYKLKKGSKEWEREFVRWILKGRTLLLRDICEEVGRTYLLGSNEATMINALDSIVHIGVREEVLQSFQEGKICTNDTINGHSADSLISIDKSSGSHTSEEDIKWQKLSMVGNTDRPEEFIEDEISNISGFTHLGWESYEVEDDSIRQSLGGLIGDKENYASLDGDVEKMLDFVERHPASTVETLIKEGFKLGSVIFVFEEHMPLGNCNITDLANHVLRSVAPRLPSDRRLDQAIELFKDGRLDEKAYDGAWDVYRESNLKSSFMPNEERAALHAAVDILNKAHHGEVSGMNHIFGNLEFLFGSKAVYQEFESFLNVGWSAERVTVSGRAGEADWSIAKKCSGLEHREKVQRQPGR